MVKLNPNVVSVNTIPAVLVNNKRLRPTLSSKNVAININVAFVSPTPTVASKSLSLLVTPAFLKILGLYRTTASMPVVCSKKWIPIAAIKTRRTDGEGLNKSSFHTPSPRVLLGGLTISSVLFSSIPAAIFMSRKRSSASSFVLDISSSIFFASPNRPCIINHLGDSGNFSMPKAKASEGIAAIPSMILHPSLRVSFEKQKFET
ncbi:hypothetical protein CFOL_v3_13002 [Cephalotus follicularis]|uniref:Uncharacterized protein n=1 Tax=Cephalotus follicularis TaxID=3775 RepID=A0A1Q3BNA1_CEPFO|nr:hypothetical protein CFOL_v3_13002 [Cephalotus follicularis]